MSTTDLFDFGMIGLGVMGRNFILNVADNNFSAAGLDLDQEKVNSLQSEGEGRKVKGFTKVEEFVESLSKPRKIMLLVPAGKIVDSVIEDLLPHVDKGDVIIDGGNSYYVDTDRRLDYLTGKGIHFLGVGVSGGAKGARIGPSIMPGGPKEAYEIVAPILEAVSAKVGGDPCVAYLGPKSAGNYVKMVHNGIEYAMMQLLSEAYAVMKMAGSDNDRLHKTFTSWNEGRLKSFLTEITAKIFAQEDPETGHSIIDLILDKGKQKGTGKWTSQDAMNLGVPLNAIDSAVTMRMLSAFKDVRVKTHELYDKPEPVEGISLDELEEHMEKALYFAFILCYTQGISMLAEASEEYGYELDMETIARIWRGGCIIRAELLEDIRKAYDADKGLTNLMTSPTFVSKLKETHAATRVVIKKGVENQIPVMTFMSCLSYFDSYKSARLALNLVQAQRDFFGSHTYERIDKKGVFHTNWGDM